MIPLLFPLTTSKPYHWLKAETETGSDVSRLKKAGEISKKHVNVSNILKISSDLFGFYPF